MSLEKLHFDNQTLRSLPIDPIQDNYVRTVRNACFSVLKPTRIENPKLVCYSLDALRLLDLNDENLIHSEQFIQCFAGNELIPGSEPAAHCYCGHQFGVFAGQLGDGAAIYLGEIINSHKERWELQLKGAGPTPYSRDGDGRKVLRSSLREFLCSEAMHHLGIASTRAATCIVSESMVQRDQFYDGNPRMEPCAVTSRIAPTFLRFGSFEIFRKLDPHSGGVGPSVGQQAMLLQMLNFVIRTYFPAIDAESVSDGEKYKMFFKDVAVRTARLVAGWQAVGFVHGVLNTDNMSILGLTIDYGPFGFMDRFDPDHVPNTSDREGRYRYEKQPEICAWNLWKLAEILASLVPVDQLKTIINETYWTVYRQEYMTLMRGKFGLFHSVPETGNDGIASDNELIEKFLETLDFVGGDFTNCFRRLNILSLPDFPDFEQSLERLRKELMKHSSTMEEMLEFYRRFWDSVMPMMRLLKFKNIPGYDDPSLIRKVERFESLKDKNSEKFVLESQKMWDDWIDLYVARIRYDIGKENPDSLEDYRHRRLELMNRHNPRIILRNHLAQNAIEHAEKGEFYEARRLLRALENPYDDDPEFEEYTEKPPPTACTLRVSCSS